METFYDQARSYLDSEDQSKDPRKLQPEAKAHCYIMLAMTLQMMHPSPIDDKWCRFGFSLIETNGKNHGLDDSTDNFSWVELSKT